MTILSLRPAEAAAESFLLLRVRQIAGSCDAEKPVDMVEAIDLLIDRLAEAERKLAKIAHALNGDGRRSA
jgi:hypothetical protein